MNSSAQTTSEGTPSDDPRELWCLLESDGVIMVNMKANDRISTLKENVHKKSGSAHGEYPKDLVLYRVSDILESGSSIHAFLGWYTFRWGHQILPWHDRAYRAYRACRAGPLQSCERFYDLPNCIECK